MTLRGYKKREVKIARGAEDRDMPRAEYDFF
jgi:hypothetical protein